jgi:peptidoglycan/LPS O-acetylase OafA/YrhL
MKLSDVAYSHENNFNLIRFLAAYAVLFSHCFVLVTGSGSNEPLLATLNYSLGGIAVDIFFVTSGFLITGSLLRRNNFIAYFKARALRIYPALCVVILLTVLLLGPLLTTASLPDYFSDSGTWRYLYRNITILPFAGYHLLIGVFENNPYPAIINGSLWTLPAELASYIAVALLWLFCSKLFRNSRKAMAILAVALTLSLLTCFYLSKFGILPQRNAFRLYFYFFAGASFFLLAETIRLDHVKASLIGFILLAAFIFTDNFYYFYVPLMIYLTMYFAYVPGGVLRKFNLVGDYSYGIYIYAFPVQQSIVFLMPDISIFEMIVYASIITVTCAVLSWHLIEKKALSYK